MSEELELLKERCDSKNYKKIVEIKNDYVFKFVAKFIKLLNPKSIFVWEDSQSDFDYIREKTIRDGEEKKLSTKRHTVHFDSYYDQGRDKEHTRLLIPKGFYLGPKLDTMDKETGVKEILGILENISTEKKLYIF